MSGGREGPGDKAWAPRAGSPAPAAAAGCAGPPRPPGRSPHMGSWSWPWVAGSEWTGSPSGGISPSAPRGGGEETGLWEGQSSTLLASPLQITSVGGKTPQLEKQFPRDLLGDQGESLYLSGLQQILTHTSLHARHCSEHSGSRGQ